MGMYPCNDYYFPVVLHQITDQHMDKNRTCSSACYYRCMAIDNNIQKKKLLI